MATSPNLVSLLNRVLILMGKSPLSLPIPLDYAPGTYGHVRLYTASEFCELARRIGFTILKTIHATWHLQSFKGSSVAKMIGLKMLLLLERCLRTVLPDLQDSWCVILER